MHILIDHSNIDFVNDSSYLLAMNEKNVNSKN